jgi:hypothetical protein
MRCEPFQRFNGLGRVIGTDTAPDALRLDMICNEVETKGDDEGKDYKEVMILRRVDDESVFVRLTKKGRFVEPEWRANYCPKAP